MRRFTILLFALALVLAACGDDDSSSATTAAPATTVADTHDDGDAHQEGDAHEDGMNMPGMSEDNIPAAVGEVTSEYTVTLSEFSFDPDPLDLTPGETVRFTLINEGALDHEFRLTTAAEAEEHVAAGHADHGGEHGDAEADIIVNVPAGETRVVEMTLPDEEMGLDQVACLIPGHYESGMHADIDF